MGDSDSAQRSEVDNPTSSDSEIRNLEKEFSKLRDQAQKLLTERVYLENEIAKLKKKATRLEDEVRALKAPPLIIGHIQDVLNESHAIVRSSNGTVFQVALNSHLDFDRIKPGTRVALNQDTLSVVSLLHDAWDPLVSGAEIMVSPNVDFSQVGGLDKQLIMLREIIELPLEKPELFNKIGIEPPKGVLLVGPPGCGKTMIAKAVASQTNATFIRMVGSELAQKYIGEGGRMVRELFSLAKDKSPSIIFLDEIDAIGAKRLDSSTSGDREVQRTLMQLLAELDGFDALADVKIIAATNRPDILDEALLRPGRFDRIIEIPVPDEESRKSIISINLSKMSTTKINMAKLISETNGFSGADLKATCIEAGMSAIRDSRNKIRMSDFTEAIKVVRNKRLDNSAENDSKHLYN